MCDKNCSTCKKRDTCEKRMKRLAAKAKKGSGKKGKKG